MVVLLLTKIEFSLFDFVSLKKSKKIKENDGEEEEEEEEDQSKQPPRPKPLPKIDPRDRGLITFVDPYIKLADLLNNEEVANNLFKRAQEINPSTKSFQRFTLHNL
jgi:hypothetical protein